MDTYLYVHETPWHNLGWQPKDDAPSTSDEIIERAGMNWEVDSIPCKTELHDSVLNYHAIYRKDTNSILGVVNKARPDIVQNIDTFRTFESMMGGELTLDTAACINKGSMVFGSFRINETYKVADDDVEHYLVVVNDHLKPDGKVAIMNTPIRVVCQNALSHALSASFYSMRVPISDIAEINVDMAHKVLDRAGLAIVDLQDNAESMLSLKIDRSSVDRMLDELFPMIKVEGETLINKTNENMELARHDFVENCLGADNLSNYRGTFYQMYNAVADWSQHYYKKADNGYDLNYRMKTLPGFAADGPSAMVSKLMKMKNKLVA